jgi:hypothetical protein
MLAPVGGQEVIKRFYPKMDAITNVTTHFPSAILSYKIHTANEKRVY